MDKTIINDELELSFAVPGHSIPVITLLNANKDLLFIIEELSKITNENIRALFDIFN